MGVFGAFFGCRGDAGFKTPLLGASSGVVGFNVATLSRLVREKVRPARSKHPKMGVFTLAGRVFRGNVAGGAVLGEFFRGNAAGGAVLGEFSRDSAAVGSCWANFVAP